LNTSFTSIFAHAVANRNQHRGNRSQTGPGTRADAADGGSDVASGSDEAKIGADAARPREHRPKSTATARTALRGRDRRGQAGDAHSQGFAGA
jgi:hypothetical protein